MFSLYCSIQSTEFWEVYANLIYLSRRDIDYMCTGIYETRERRYELQNLLYLAHNLVWAIFSLQRGPSFDSFCHAREVLHIDLFTYLV